MHIMTLGMCQNKIIIMAALFPLCSICKICSLSDSILPFTTHRLIYTVNWDGFSLIKEQRPASIHTYFSIMIYEYICVEEYAWRHCKIIITKIDIKIILHFITDFISDVWKYLECPQHNYQIRNWPPIGWKF